MAILIVRGSRLGTDALANALENAGFAVILDARTAEAQDSAVDVVLISAEGSVPGLIASIRKCRMRFGRAKVVLVGAERSDHEIVSFIEAGMHAYTSSDSPLESLLETIRSVQRGETLCSGRIGALVSARIASLARRRPENAASGNLTAREQEILRLVAAGLSNKEIAQRLAISSNTVKIHVHRILEKLRVGKRRDAARWASVQASGV